MAGAWKGDGKKGILARELNARHGGLKVLSHKVTTQSWQEHCKTSNCTTTYVAMLRKATDNCSTFSATYICKRSCEKWGVMRYKILSARNGSCLHWVACGTAVGSYPSGAGPSESNDSSLAFPESKIARNTGECSLFLFLSEKVCLLCKLRRAPYADTEASGQLALETNKQITIINTTTQYLTIDAFIQNHHHDPRYEVKLKR